MCSDQFSFGVISATPSLSYLSLLCNSRQRYLRAHQPFLFDAWGIISSVILSSLCHVHDDEDFHITLLGQITVSQIIMTAFQFQQLVTRMLSLSKKRRNYVQSYVGLTC